MGLLPPCWRDGEYLDESCAKTCGWEEFDSSCLWQIKTYNRATSHSDSTVARSGSEWSSTVWTAGITRIHLKCRLFFWIEGLVVDPRHIRIRKSTMIMRCIWIQQENVDLRCKWSSFSSNILWFEAKERSGENRVNQLRFFGLNTVVHWCLSWIHSVRRIWQATTKQITFEHQVAIVERQFSTKHLRPLSTIFDLMTDGIDEILIQPNDAR